MRNNYGNIWEPPYVDKIILPAKAPVICRQHGASQPCGSASLWASPLAPPFILDTAKWAPNLCMSVSGLCSSVFYVKWASFGCVTQQRCFVYLCCVFCVFSCYSRLVSLQSTIHQHLWNLLVITPTTTVDLHFSCLYAGVDSIYFGLNSRQPHPHT